MQRRTVPRVYLADLTLKPANMTVCVRVMRKWIYDGNEPGGRILHMDFVLADEKVYDFLYRLQSFYVAASLSSHVI